MQTDNDIIQKVISMKQFKKRKLIERMLEIGDSCDFTDWIYENYFYVPFYGNEDYYENNISRSGVKNLKAHNTLKFYNIQNYIDISEMVLHNCICTQNNLHHHHIFISIKTGGIIFIGSSCVKYFDNVPKDFIKYINKLEKDTVKNFKLFLEKKHDAKKSDVESKKVIIFEKGKYCFTPDIPKQIFKKPYKKIYKCYKCGSPWSYVIGCASYKCNNHKF